MSASEPSQTIQNFQQSVDRAKFKNKIDAIFMLLEFNISLEQIAKTLDVDIEWVRRIATEGDRQLWSKFTCDYTCSAIED
jgi:predicted transposase YdaD